MLKTYDFKQVSVIIGSRPMHGMISVSVERENPMWVKQVGADGEVARAKSNDKSGIITLVMQQTSEENSFLASLSKTDEATNLGVVPVLIRDASGLSLHSAEEAWIERAATAEYAAEAGEREWVLHCSELITFPGGN